MSDDKKNETTAPFSLLNRYQREFIEVACPVCNERRIIVVPEEPFPRCERCKVDMVIKEILTEGKY